MRALPFLLSLILTFAVLVQAQVKPRKYEIDLIRRKLSDFSLDHFQVWDTMDIYLVEYT